MDFSALAQNVGKTVTSIADAGINIQKSKEANERLQQCGNSSIKTDAVQLLEYMKGDRINIVNSKRGRGSPSVFTGWNIRNIMEKYPEGSVERKELTGCIGELNMGEIKYRMSRFWWDTGVMAIGVMMAIIILIITIIAVVTKPKEGMRAVVLPANQILRPIGHIRNNTPNWMKNMK